MTLNEITKKFKSANIPNPENDALIIASHFTGKDKSMLICSRDDELGENEALTTAVDKRISRYPLQYIIGTWNFMGLDFKVNENVLIPRSDTEILCEFILKNLPKNGRMLDLCTGSGCIAISVKEYRPDSDVFGIDIAPQALEIAKENSQNILENNSIEFILSDVTAAVPESLGLFDIICSNPPYVTLSEMAILEKELSFEPRIALTDEGDGLRIIKSIVHNYKKMLKPDGILAIEHGNLQGENVRNIFIREGFTANTIKDYSGNERVTFGKINKKD